MAKMASIPDKIEGNLKGAAAKKPSGSVKLHNPINNLGDYAHPAKKKSKKK